MTLLELAPDRTNRSAALRDRVRLLRDLRRDGIDLATRQVPVEPENGDFVVVTPLGEQRWLVAVGDVMGSGSEAAALARRIAAHVEERARHARNLGDLAATANDVVFAETDGDCFASLVLLVVDGRCNTLRLANAGHVEPLAVGRGGGVVSLGGHGPALGVMRGMEYRESGPIRMAPGMVLALVTDGIIDALDDDGEPFGKSRLAGVLARSRTRGSRAVVRAVHDAVDAHAAHDDDRTVATLRFV